jgi:hypothetical protein
VLNSHYSDVQERRCETNAPYLSIISLAHSGTVATILCTLTQSNYVVRSVNT